jgi:hypothetical protein
MKRDSDPEFELEFLLFELLLILFEFEFELAKTGFLKDLSLSELDLLFPRTICAFIEFEPELELV